MHNDQIFIDIDVHLKNTAASPHPQIVLLRSKPLDSIVQPRSFCTRSSMARRVVGLATLSKSCASESIVLLPQRAQSSQSLEKWVKRRSAETTPKHPPGSR